MDTPIEGYGLATFGLGVCVPARLVRVVIVLQLCSRAGLAALGPSRGRRWLPGWRQVSLACQ